MCPSTSPLPTNRPTTDHPTLQSPCQPTSQSISHAHSLHTPLLPQGKWCAVDPEKCTRFAGYIGVDSVNKFAFDYCDVLAPSLKARPSCKPWSVAEWEQCGGKSNCTEWGCMDEQWAGACCAKGLECRRQDSYYVRRGRGVGAGLSGSKVVNCDLRSAVRSDVECSIACAWVAACQGVVVLCEQAPW